MKIVRLLWCTHNTQECDKYPWCDLLTVWPGPAEGVSALSLEGKENICAEWSHQPVTKRIGLGQTDNVLFSLPYPAYLQQNRDNGGLLVHGLCAPEKWRGKCSGAFFVCVCLSFLPWQGTLTIWVQLWLIRENFWVVCRGDWVEKCVCFYFGFSLILLPIS